MRLRMSDIVGILNFPPSFMHNVLKSLGFLEINPWNDDGTLTYWIGVVCQMPEAMLSTKGEMLSGGRLARNSSVC